MTSGALAWPLGFVLIRSLAIIEAVRPSRAISSGSGVAATHIPAADAHHRVPPRGLGDRRCHRALSLLLAMVLGTLAFLSTEFHRGRDTPWAQEWPTYRRSVYGSPRGFLLASRRASHGGRWQAFALWLSAHDLGEPWWHRGPAEALGLSSCRSRIGGGGAVYRCHRPDRMCPSPASSSRLAPWVFVFRTP